MKHKITICMGSSCFARGNEKNLRLIQDFLAEHNLSANVALVGARCSGDCSGSPNISIDDVRYEQLDKPALLSLLQTKLLA